MSSELGHVSWSRDSRFKNASTSRRRVLIFCMQHLLSSNKNTLSKNCAKNSNYPVVCGGEGNFKVRRLCKDFLARFWGRGNSQTSYIVTSFACSRLRREGCTLGGFAAIPVSLVLKVRRFVSINLSDLVSFPRPATLMY